MTSWERDLEEAQRRLAELDVERETAAALAAETGRRCVERFSAFFLPIPFVAQDVPSLDGAWCDDGEEVVALDGRGRPVAHLLARGRPTHLWTWHDDGSFVEIELMGSGPHVRRVRRDWIAAASAHGEESVSLLTWSDGVAVRGDSAWRYAGGGGALAATVLDLEAGAYQRLRRAAEDGSGDLAAGLARAAELEPERVVWDGRVERPEPWPGAEAAAALVEPLARTLEGALRAALAESGVKAPFVLHVHGSEERQLPPLAMTAGAAWRDRIRAKSKYDDAPLERLNRGGVRLDVVDRLDPDACYAIRVFSTALRVGAPWDLTETAAPLAERLGDRLAELLNGTPPAGAADPFLALVEIGGPYSGRGLERAFARAGAMHVRRFRRSIASTAPRPASAAAALTDRDALATLLETAGLGAHARRLAHEVALEGLLIEEGPGRRSRLGGPPLLPRGVEWPAGMTFLAGLDLTELPPSPLPDSGWMLFFADLDDETGIVDVAENLPGELARVFVTDDPVEAEPRGRPPAYVPIAPRPVLTLPSDYDAASRLGLDDVEATVYEEQLERLAEALLDPHGAAHWIGGHACGTQGHPPDEGTVLLLHLSDDRAIDFPFQDDGTLQFRIPADALAARDWSRIVAYVESA